MIPIVNNISLLRNFSLYIRIYIHLTDKASEPLSRGKWKFREVMK